MGQAPGLRGFGSAADYEDCVIASLRPRLDHLVLRWVEAGQPLPDRDELAAVLTSAVPDAIPHSEYDRLLGPFYSSRGVMRLLNIPTRQALSDRRSRGTVLAASTSDDVWVYPAFQFDTRARGVRRELVPLLSALKPAPRWGAALWLVTPHPELGGVAPIDRAGDVDAAFVARLAAQYADAVSA